MKLSVVRLSLFIVISIVSVWVAFLSFSVDECVRNFRALGYWVTASMVMLFGYVALRDDWRRYIETMKRRESIVAGAIILVVAIFMFTRESSGFKVSLDEELLSIVAKSMHVDHEPVVRESTLMGYSHYELIDKRPLLFPYLLSVVHDLFGYRMENVFYLNFALTIALLALLRFILTKAVGSLAGWYAVFITACMPLFAQNASGGGFELLNLVCFLLCSVYAARFWTNPSDGNLSRLFVSAAIASQVRYESVVILIPALALVFANWIRQKEIRIPSVVLFLPLSFIPLVWQFRVVLDKPSNWQFNDSVGGTFGALFLERNLEALMEYFLFPSRLYAGSPIVGAIGLGFMIGLMVIIATRRDRVFSSRGDRVAIVTMSLYSILQIGIVLFFKFGVLTDPALTRLAFPFILLVVACCGVGLGYLHRIDRVGVFVSLAICVAAFSYASSLYSRPEYTTNRPIHLKMEAVIRFFENREGMDNSLVVSSLSRIFEPREINNLGIRYARARLKEIAWHMSHGTYREVYVVQFGEMIEAEGRWESRIRNNDDLGSAVELEVLGEVRYMPYAVIRFCRVARIDVDAVDSAEYLPLEDASVGEQYGIPSEAMKLWREKLP